MSNDPLPNDTIVAISTPPGTGGIAVVRVSGPQALQVVAQRWQGADLSTVASHTAHLGHVTDSAGNLLDEVVATVFRAPHSYTGEDVVELSCHGSTWIQQHLVLTLIDAGARMAQPGEFTRRAFANGRMDLAQAEAVADVIAAQSAAAHRVALNQLRGHYSSRLEQLRQQLLQFASLLELELDFSEEDVTFADREQLLNLAHEIAAEIDRLSASFEAGNVIRNGLPVAIVGATNAGKSTLLNALLHDDRAIVSDIHGTTRDTIEDTITLGNTLMRIIDTAGLRSTTDTIEAMGVERSLQRLDQAAIIIWVIDATGDDALALASDILPRAAGRPLIAVINKCDLADGTAVAHRLTHLNDFAHRNGDTQHEGDAQRNGGTNVITISAHNSADIDRLTALLIDTAALPSLDSDTIVVTNARHYHALQAARAALTRAIDGLSAGLTGDLIDPDIRETLHHIGTITGAITTTDILTTIFTHFCVGK